MKIMIQSSSSKQIKYLNSLQNKAKVRNEMKQFVVEGERITKEIPEDMLVSMYVSESYEKQSSSIPFKEYDTFCISADEHLDCFTFWLL